MILALDYITEIVYDNRNMNRFAAAAVKVIRMLAPAVDGDFDLLGVPAIRAAILRREFPGVLRLCALAVFAALAVLAWGVFAPSGVNAKLFAKTHPSTLLIWGVWWPAMVWVAVLFGRLWCMVCPLELVSAAGGRAGEAIGLPRRPLPGWIASGAVIVGLYALIQLLVAGAHINRVPAYTSLFLIGLLTTAMFAGAFFRDRAFCRGFCPVGLLLGTYGRGGMLAVRPGPRAVPADARTCPSILNPPKLDSNKDCLVCCKCVQACEPGHMRLLLRAPFSQRDGRQADAPWPVTLFVMLVSGFVTWELTTEWPAAEGIFLTVPVFIAAKLGWPWAAGWLEGVWALVVVPLSMWTALAAVLRLLGARESVGGLWRKMAVPLAVVVSVGHMSKGLAKFVSWAPFLPEALRDPAKAIASKAAAAPPALLSLSTVGLAGLGLLLAAACCAVREIRLADKDAHPWAPLPVIVLSGAFALIILGWILQ